MISFENHCFIAQSILTLTQKLRNSYIEIKQRSILIKMEKDVMGEKLQRLYDAMEHLGTLKIIQDKYQAEIEVFGY